jgi:3-isopropylmalate/(R)-2-methylmalate dehydratase small subunit
MDPIVHISSRTVLLPLVDIDTDQIIPARFLKATSREGMGDHLFADLRFSADGSPKPSFPLNKPESAGASILIAGANFGCGSSREHAAWALVGFGFRVVISTSFADIFRGNALKNGLVPVQLASEAYNALVSWTEENPSGEVTVDVDAQEVGWGASAVAKFDIDPFSKVCLVKGTDELGFILGMVHRIDEYERILEKGGGI